MTSAIRHCDVSKCTKNDVADDSVFRTVRIACVVAESQGDVSVCVDNTVGWLTVYCLRGWACDVLADAELALGGAAQVDWDDSRWMTVRCSSTWQYAGAFGNF